MLSASTKRALDVGVSSLALTVLSPLLLALAILIRFDDGGPALFRQQRAGQHGRPFTIYKFRSMPVASSTTAHFDPTEWTHGVPDDFTFKSPSAGDGSFTRWGPLLRRTSLDELPQLLNVLRGDMSLVGPRPELPSIAERYDAVQARRLVVKPGLTGWAQVNGRATSNHGAKIAADLYYVERASLALDLKIVVRTALLILTGKGAF